MQIYKNRLEIENHIKEVWNLSPPTSFELKNWPCHYNLNISPSFLIGKVILDWRTHKNAAIITEYIMDKTGFKIIDNFKNIRRLRYSCIQMVNPFTNKKEIIPLFFRKNGCSNIFKDGYYINQKDFKSLYYKTEEYSNKFRDTLLKKYNVDSIMDIPGHKDKIMTTMNERYGVDWFLKRGNHYEIIEDKMIEKYGCIIPIHSQEIKSQISSTMKERYNVDWFLNRGKHYEKITNVMISKYGVENIFELTGTYFTQSHTSISKAERNFFEILLESIQFKNPICALTTTSQHVIKRKKFSYIVDFYDEESKVIIEFLGDFWHCNPTIYGEDYMHPYKKKTAKTIWQYDTKRKQEIINLTNTTFIEVWENDWNKDKQLVISNITALLNGKQ